MLPHHCASKLILIIINIVIDVKNICYPVAVLHIDVPPASLDVNLEPNKTTVLLNDMVS